MHREGLLHRDLKPDNMGILSREQPFVVLFDLGMTRMYTDEVGQVRLPRTTCPFRGTPEWASGWAQKGRDKSGFNDLIGWLFVCCELYDSSPITIQPLPWTYRRSSKILTLLKTNHCPAFILLSRAPRQFTQSTHISCR
uniref:Protein kinase domain-containing protein n=2 Tax=Parascaris univalens TaxID=6257 RepID=A0A915CDM0_PARUN